MPAYNYKCPNCNFVNEYNTNVSLPKEFRPPEDMMCPQCKATRLEIDVASSVQGISFDVPGGYDYEYGKKAWKRNMSISDQAKVLEGKKDPY
jgi:phage FluMu protein Com